MLPTIYTTYGLAMGHPPELLADSGGLKPIGTKPLSTRPALVDMVRARGWLKAAVGRVCRWCRDRDARSAHGRPTAKRARTVGRRPLPL